MKYIQTSIIALIVITGTLFVSCREDKQGTADRKVAIMVEKAMGEALNAVGQPSIKNWKELKDAKMIYELRDQEDFICYAYIVNMMGEYKFLGRCVGYGLPYSVQFSNPEKVVDYDDFIGGRAGHVLGTLPQPEPNGLFMPEGLAATWIMLIDPSTGEPRPVYVEPEILVSPFPLHKVEAEK